MVTGGNSGIGLKCVRALLDSGVEHLVIAGRNAQALSSMSSTLRPRTSTLLLDLSLLDSIRTAAKLVGERLASGQLPALPLVLCDAGLQTASSPIRYSADGYDVTFATNHLGHFLLVHGLLPLMTRPGRIIVTSSGTRDAQTLEGRFNKPV